MTPAQRREWRKHVLSGDSGLTPTQRCILMTLQERADYGDGTNAWGGAQSLADECGVTKRAVKVALNCGQDLNLIRRTDAERGDQPHRGHAAVYRLLPLVAGVHRYAPVNPGAPGGVNRRTPGRCTPVPPTKSIPNPSPGVRESGTSPRAAIALVGDSPALSPFCAEHPEGTARRCTPCGDARERFNRQREIDQKAHQQRAREIRENCPDCLGTNVVETGEDEVRKCDHRASRRPQAVSNGC